MRDASYERGGFWQVIDRGQWQVAGSAPEVYERELVPAVFGPWTQVVVYFADLRSGDRVLDVACGTGVVARIAAEKVGERGAVVAADLNPVGTGCSKAGAGSSGCTGCGGFIGPHRSSLIGWPRGWR